MSTLFAKFSFLTGGGGGWDFVPVGAIGRRCGVDTTFAPGDGGGDDDCDTGIIDDVGGDDKCCCCLFWLKILPSASVTTHPAANITGTINNNPFLIIRVRVILLLTL
jgi:hypothetical protein